jgi:hypothetical protein
LHGTGHEVLQGQLGGLRGTLAAGAYVGTCGCGRRLSPTAAPSSATFTPYRSLTVDARTSRRPIHVGRQLDSRPELLAGAGVDAEMRVVVTDTELATAPGYDDGLREMNYLLPLPPNCL